MRHDAYKIDDSGRYLDFAMTSLFRETNIIQEKTKKLLSKGFKFELFADVLWHNRVPRRCLEKLRVAVPTFYPEEAKGLLKKHSQRTRIMSDYIHLLLDVFSATGINFLIIKTLDNYPDFGHDVDILTLVPGKTVSSALLSKGFEQIRPNIAERIADKLNFSIGDYPSAEVHCGRLGEVGEHRKLCKMLFKERICIDFEGRKIYVPSPESRIILVALQRTYRHFNIRACDVLNIATLFSKNSVNISKLKDLALEVGIWPGVLKLLNLVSEILVYYNQAPVFKEYISSDNVYAARRLYRFPLWSNAISVYFHKFMTDIFKLNGDSIARIMLIPLLSLNAYLGLVVFQREGIW